MGAAFALLAYTELATGGAYFPPRPEVWKPLMPGLPFDWVLLALWIFHATLVSILATIALVEFDESRLPKVFYIFVLLAGLLPPLVWPELRVTFLHKRNAMAWTPDATAQQSLQYMVFGAVLGTCLGWSFDPRRSERNRVIQLAAALGAVGLFLGDATLSIVTSLVVAPAMIVLRLLTILVPFLKWTPRSSFVLTATLLTVGAWPESSLELAGKPDTDGLPALIVLITSVILVFLHLVLDYSAPFPAETTNHNEGDNAKPPLDPK